MALKVTRPRLWRIRDPRKLVSLGQLYLPGLEIETTKTTEEAWSELVSASPDFLAGLARRDTGPGRGRAGPAGKDWRFEHEDG
ncbi:hypothetical protein LCGC14_2283080 [marine sediment metagenome]|uniref:Uncharacterized protein n=1 Tax=marine sediment metagenome TaxID=412755 RepID=A0A0F9DFW1_9ZZZZ